MLDVTSYMSPGVSYDKFLKAFDVVENKGFFPYEWFDGVDKLNHPTLPSREDFYSSLKDCNISTRIPVLSTRLVRLLDVDLPRFSDMVQQFRRRAFRPGRPKFTEDLFRPWYRRFQDLHLRTRSSTPDAL